MAAVNDLNQWETEVGGDVHSARVALGAVMVATVVAVALGANFFGPAVAAMAAATMLPILFVSALRAPLDDCSIYGSLARRR